LLRSLTTSPLSRHEEHRVFRSVSGLFSIFYRVIPGSVLARTIRRFVA
jgi:hypothetical protein